MAIWHGYILLEKPAVLTLGEWRTALVALRAAWNRVPDDPQPARRLHWRLSVDQTKIIMEASFDTEVVNIGNAATVINGALPQYTVAQITTSLQNNLTLWRVGKDRALSLNEALAYVDADRTAWNGPL